MQVTEQIVNKTILLQELFKTTQQFVETESNLDLISDYLEQQNIEFISIAYEATAMVLAQKDLAKGNTLSLWKAFLIQKGQYHAIQIHIGLGWALGQKRLNPEPYITNLEPLLAWRVWDGYGYYDGFFRKRKTLQGLLPEHINERAMMVYTQGIGRSLWYTCKADLSKLQQLIDAFSTDRKIDIWRGVGIASTYVGGGDVSYWQQLWNMAAPYQPQLAAGAALAIKSRNLAKTIVQDTELIAHEWLQLSITQIVNLLEKKASDSIVASPWVYHTWIAKIDKEFNKN